MENGPLLQVLTRTEPLSSLSLREWDRLLPLARQTGTLGRIQAQLAGYGLLADVPEQVRPHLDAAAVIAAEHERMIRWEVNRIRRALLNIPIPVILLKGAAYVMADLPCARGRLVSDVDILVSRENLGTVERALQAQGWETEKLDPYDQRYYRRWMHELPPLRHRLRRTVVDLHHTILPQTSRLKPNPDKLLAAALPVKNTPFKVLAPADMVLHSAAHAFHDGDLSNGLRDLLDLHDLLSHFGKEQKFWEVLPCRAREIDLARPLYYALRYSHRFFDTPIPATVIRDLQSAAPPEPMRLFMDRLVNLTVLATPSARSGRLSPGAATARWLLYVRSHWLRMPPRLLTGHLLRKAVKRFQVRTPHPN